MPDPKLPRKVAAKGKKRKPRRQGVEGLAAAVGRNREREARLRIIEAFGRLGISHDQWPKFVRAFYADPQQRTEYHQFTMPLLFQAPDFDPLNESPQDWVKRADKAWKLHRDGFLQKLEDWVSTGIDEEIPAAKRVRGTGKKVPAHVGGRRRGGNTPIDRRYEWAAKCLMNVPLKEIAGVDADAATVGRVVREILRLSDWV